MSIAVVFEARGERGRNLSEVPGNYTGDNNNNDYGQGRTITATYNFTRGNRLVFRSYAGGAAGSDPQAGGFVSGAPGGAAAALRLGDTTDIVIAGGGGGMGARNGNDGGDAGSRVQSNMAGGQDGGGNNMGGKGGNQENGGAGGSKYNDSSAGSTDGSTGGNRVGGDGGNGAGKAGDSGGGGGGGYGGGGGGGGHGDNDNEGGNNGGGGGGGDSFLHASAYSVSESLNTNTTAQVIITYSGTDVTLNTDGAEFIVSTPTTFNDTTFSFTKDVLSGTINLSNEGVFSDTITKTYTYFYRVKSVGSYVESPNALELSTNTSLFITQNDVITFARTASVVERIEMEVYTEATVTGITETSNTFTITLEFTNNPPTVTAITQSVHWNSIDNSFNFSGSDLDGDPLSYSIATTAGAALYGASISDANNSVTVAGSQFIVGSSNNSTFRFFYRAHDGFNFSTPEQITINKLNQRPKVNDITESVHWNSTDNTFDFSGNDADGDSLVYTISSSSSGPYGENSLSLPSGTVTLDLTFKKFIIDSSNNTTITFYYRANDGSRISSGGMATITKSNENAPTAFNIVKFTHTDPVIIYLFGSDDDSDSFSFSLGTKTQNYGTWSGITASNQITYTPTGNSLGSDTYGYSISDSVDSNNYTITVYSGLTNIKDGGQDLTELYKRKHDNTAGNITLTNNKSNYQVNGTDLVNIFEREDGEGTSTSNLKVTVGATTYALDKIFKKR
jgi:hypothetical protein